MKTFVKACIIAAIATPLVAETKPSLWTYPRVDQGLFDMGVAYGIKENCDSIGERTFYGTTFALSLANYAQNQGYSYDEVRKFWRSKKEREALRVRVTKYLEDQGLDTETPNALCDYGEEQMVKKTQVGKFLRKE
ncbi:MAG: DUF5333 domain-containing protein [Pseudomonadota bacterium]